MPHAFPIIERATAINPGRNELVELISFMKFVECEYCVFSSAGFRVNASS